MQRSKKLAIGLTINTVILMIVFTLVTFWTNGSEALDRSALIDVTIKAAAAVLVSWYLLQRDRYWVVRDAEAGAALVESRTCTKLLLVSDSQQAVCNTEWPETNGKSLKDVLARAAVIQKLKESASCIATALGEARDLLDSGDAISRGFNLRLVDSIESALKSSEAFLRLPSEQALSTVKIEVAAVYENLGNGGGWHG